MPGYEAVKGLPPTRIYRWVQEQAEPQRIYAAGLRPYGLYGSTWQNTVRYDLHSTALEPLATGVARIEEMVGTFRPDLILISVDPHPESGATPRKPAVAAWMRSRERRFQEVFQDATVSAFRVLPVP